MEATTDKARPDDDASVRKLYADLLERWNKRSARDFAALFEPGGNVVGFDGSMHNGPAEIESALAQIFSHHPTAAYVGKVRSVRFPVADAAVLRAVAGMVPPGQADINPAVNAIQTLVATRTPDGWRITLFQNTPAAFHGRPEVGAQLTAELREALRASSAR